MPRKSIRERTEALDRALLSSDRWVDALLIVVSRDGEELFRVGGCWDRVLRRYVNRPCAGRVFYLRRSQTEMGRAIGRYLANRLSNQERVALMMAIGNRGGGKTLLLGGVLIVALALLLPSCWQMGVSITSKQNRELRAAIARVAAPGWVTVESDDPRDPHTEFLTGARVLWMTSRNPSALRQALLPFEHVLVNEAQDQGEEVFINAISAIRSGGLTTIATNPPRDDGGDWVAILYKALEAGSSDGEAYILDNRDNDAVSQPKLKQIGRLLRLVNPQKADADAEGVIKLAGDVAYPGFSRLPRYEENGTWVRGHVGFPPEPPDEWQDVTRALTAALPGSSSGVDFVAGCDFQTDPGSCAAVGKLYRLEDGQLLLFIHELVATTGSESDLTFALNSRGYYPGDVDYDGRPADRGSLLLVGDATGARQNAEHRRRDPYSFTRLRADGWTVLPPDYYGPKRTPWNPLIADSRKQMKALFGAGAILLSPDCEIAAEGFPSLVDSFVRSKVTPAGKFEKKGHYTHGPDGVRYLAWRFLPRPQAPRPQGFDRDTFNRVRAKRPLTSA